MKLLPFAVLLVASSCGGGIDRHAAYQRIQIAEARSAHALHEDEALEPDERERRCDVACEASEAIAREAASLGAGMEGGVDPDAARRADEAARACTGCRAR